MRPRLKLFVGDETETYEEPQVAMRLSEITRILTDAQRWDRTWLNDLGNDEVRVSADLYEILTAYSHLRPSA